MPESMMCQPNSTRAASSTAKPSSAVGHDTQQCSTVAGAAASFKACEVHTTRKAATKKVPTCNPVTRHHQGQPQHSTLRHQTLLRQLPLHMLLLPPAASNGSASALTLQAYHHSASCTWPGLGFISTAADASAAANAAAASAAPNPRCESIPSLRELRVV